MTVCPKCKKQELEGVEEICPLCNNKKHGNIVKTVGLTAAALLLAVFLKGKGGDSA